MKAIQAQVFFDPAGVAVSFRAHDGTRERGVVRRVDELGDRPLPKPATTYAELFAALQAASDTFTAEDVAQEVADAAAEQKRRADCQAAERAAVAAWEKKNKPKP